MGSLVSSRQLRKQDLQRSLGAHLLLRPFPSSAQGSRSGQLPTSALLDTAGAKEPPVSGK